jgi:hypothetical protein
MAALIATSARTSKRNGNGREDSQIALPGAAKAATKYPRLVEAARFQRSAVSIQLQHYLYILGKILNREDHKDL